MSEFFSYSNAKANEIPTETYVDIGYFEPLNICNSSLKQKPTKSEQILPQNTEKFTSELCHE